MAGGGATLNSTDDDSCLAHVRLLISQTLRGHCSFRQSTRLLLSGRPPVLSASASSPHHCQNCSRHCLAARARVLTWAWWLTSGITTRRQRKCHYTWKRTSSPQAYMGRVADHLEAGVRSLGKTRLLGSPPVTHPLRCPPHKVGHGNRIPSTGFALILS